MKTRCVGASYLCSPCCRPISHEAAPLRIVAAICCPSRCSITGFQGTRLNPLPSSSMA
ncbi:transcriptional regulator, MarR family [Enterocytozoon bieneusi H348]|nr:transcriptional regulator, MarR family [Enterocytozoon bieneusi H348]|eukprot:XP_002652294.1 transcriptional regulator, MarR family [Enterocytozoon bieneusi H348]